MKCRACKYEYEKRMMGLGIEGKGDEEFLTSKTPIIVDDCSYRGERVETVYICPKCGTLKINL